MRRHDEGSAVPARPLVIGITGPIACGKSTVARMLGDLGATVIDADDLAREVTGLGQPTLSPIRTRFGGAVFADDGSLDRSALASIVFSDAAALRDLEAIVHPAVRERIEAALDAAKGALMVVIEAIKLVEGGLAERCDEVWLIDCSTAAQRERAMARGVTTDDLAQRTAAQGRGLIDRLGHAATRRIPTDGSLEETRASVEEALADALEPLL